MNADSLFASSVISLNRFGYHPTIDEPEGVLAIDTNSPEMPLLPEEVAMGILGYAYSRGFHVDLASGHIETFPPVFEGERETHEIVFSVTPF